MKEEAEVSFEDNTITVDLKFIHLSLYLEEKGEVKFYQTPFSSSVRYEFILNDDVLNFKRIISTMIDDGGNPLVFTAVYSESTSSDQTQNIQIWTLQEVISNPDTKEFSSSNTTPLLCSYKAFQSLCPKEE